MKKIVAAIMLALVCASGAMAAESITFEAANGAVAFPHKQHQESLKECAICHQKGPGKIEGFGKEVAHQLCKGCHAERSAGPTKCSGCHKK